MLVLKESALLLTFTIVLDQVIASNPPKPNIVMIVADDMGFNDIGFHGSDQFPTHNIDALAAFGILLNRYYVQPICTPSRSALMTGKYPLTVGMQHYVIAPQQPFGLGLNEKLLPEYLKSAGYETHIIGKWHLGAYKKEYTPTFRGFDSHIGYLGAGVDYYNHSLKIDEFPWANGYDMRNNLELYRESYETYATDVFTQASIKVIETHNRDNPLFLYISHLAPHAGNSYEPLQAPQQVIDKFAYIKDENRRKYAAMVSMVDDSVGTVVNALKENQMLDNTVILFFCDNGSPSEGQLANTGSNNPFRGQKLSPWEGGVRSAAAIWSPLLQTRERTSNQLFHITDWLPTFANLAGVSVSDTSINGKDIWSALSDNLDSPREDVVSHFDNIDGIYAYVRGDYKYINGTTFDGIHDRWMGNIDKNEKHPSFENYGESIINSTVGQALARYSLRNLTPLAIENHRKDSIITCNNVPIPTESQFQCRPLESPCLFNIIDDPCERINIALQRPATFELMEIEIKKYQQIAQPIRNKPDDERSNPAKFNGTWTWWFDELGIPDHKENVASSSSKYNYAVISVSLLYKMVLATLSNVFKHFEAVHIDEEYISSKQ